MLYTFERLAIWLRENVGRHLNASDLMALLDGEFTESRASKAWAHVAHCSSCRNKLKQLEQGLALFRKAESSFQADEGYSKPGLERLHQSIEAWNESHPGPDALPSQFLGSPLYEALAKELEIYLGSRTALALLKQCDATELNANKLTAIVEPIVTAFLGREPGLAVLTKLQLIWNRLHPDTLSLGLPT